MAVNPRNVAARDAKVIVSLVDSKGLRDMMAVDDGRGDLAAHHADAAQRALICWVVEVVDAATATSSVDTIPAPVPSGGAEAGTAAATTSCASVSMMTVSSAPEGTSAGVHGDAPGGVLAAAVTDASAAAAAASTATAAGPVISAPLHMDASSAIVPALLAAVRGNPVLQPFVAQLCLGVLVRKVPAHGSALATAFGWGAQERLLRLETRAGIGGE